MEEFPNNSRRPTRPARDEPKRVERVITGEVQRRKVPLGRRFLQNVIGDDVHSVWGFIAGDILIPGIRDVIADGLIGGVERAILRDNAPRGRSRSRGGHVAYNTMSSRRSNRDEPRREMSRRGRANHSFDEIILDTRVEAQEVIDRLDDMAQRYDNVTVADLYEMVGISGNYVDKKWGWTDLRDAYVSRTRNGYLLNLPRAEPID